MSKVVDITQDASPPPVHNLNPTPMTAVWRAYLQLILATRELKGNAERGLRTPEELTQKAEELMRHFKLVDKYREARSSDRDTVRIVDGETRELTHIAGANWGLNHRDQDHKQHMETIEQLTRMANGDFGETMETGRALTRTNDDGMTLIPPNGAKALEREVLHLYKYTNKRAITALARAQQALKTLYVEPNSLHGKDVNELAKTWMKSEEKVDEIADQKFKHVYNPVSAIKIHSASSDLARMAKEKPTMDVEELFLKMNKATRAMLHGANIRPESVEIREDGTIQSDSLARGMEDELPPASAELVLKLRTSLQKMLEDAGPDPTRVGRFVTVRKGAAHDPEMETGENSHAMKDATGHKQSPISTESLSSASIAAELCDHLLTTSATLNSNVNLPSLQALGAAIYCVGRLQICVDRNLITPLDLSKEDQIVLQSLKVIEQNTNCEESDAAAMADLTQAKQNLELLAGKSLMLSLLDDVDKARSELKEGMVKFTRPNEEVVKPDESSAS